MGAIHQAVLAAFGNPAAGGGGPDFDPTTVTGCTMWMSADDPLAAAFGAGNPVTTWTDQVTGTRTWSEGASESPLYRLTGSNGEPFLEFDNVNDNYLYSVATSNLFTASAFTMFAVVRPQSNGTTTGTENGKNVFTSLGYVGLNLFSTGGNNKFSFYRFNGSYARANSTTTFVLNTWYIVECWYDGTNLNIKVNNDTTVSTAASNPSQLTDAPRMGWVATAGFDISELDTWNVALNSTDRDTVRNGLAAKYGITV